MYISVAEARSRLSLLLRRVRDQPVTITRRGQPVGIIISLQEYESLRRVQAYLQMLRISRSLRDSGMTADELFQVSREELEGRL